MNEQTTQRVERMRVFDVYSDIVRQLNLRLPNASRVHGINCLLNVFSGYVELYKEGGELNIDETFQEMRERDPSTYRNAANCISKAIRKFHVSI